MFVLDNAMYVDINVVPNNVTRHMSMKLEYRLVNKQEQQYMN